MDFLLASVPNFDRDILTAIVLAAATLTLVLVSRRKQLAWREQATDITVPLPDQCRPEDRRKTVAELSIKVRNYA